MSAMLGVGEPIMNITWSTAPLTVRDMYDLMTIRTMLSGTTTPDAYAACLSLITRRGSLSMDWIMDQDADYMLALLTQCTDSINSMIASNAILKQSFGA